MVGGQVDRRLRVTACKCLARPGSPNGWFLPNTHGSQPTVVWHHVVRSGEVFTISSLAMELIQQQQPKPNRPKQPRRIDSDIKRAKKALSRLRRQRERGRVSRQTWVDEKMGSHKTRDELAADGVEENPGPGRPSTSGSDSASTGSSAGKSWGYGPKSGLRKPPIACFVCGKPGHKAAACRSGTKGKQREDDPVEPEDYAKQGHPLNRVIEVVSQVDRTNKASVLMSRFDGLDNKTALALVDAGLFDAATTGDNDLNMLRAAAGLDPPTEKPAAPVVAPVMGTFLTESEFAEAMGGNKPPTFLRKVWRTAINPWSWLGVLLSLTVALGVIFTCSAYRVLYPWVENLVSIALLTAWIACFGVYWEEHDWGEAYYETEVQVGDVDMAQDDRLRTTTHVGRLDRPIRVHRYRWRKRSRWWWEDDDWKRIYVVDHWAAVAQSEFGHGADVTMFLKNVHLKFLRCGELGIDARDYDLYKRGTTKFLKYWLRHSGFRQADVRNWQGRAATAE